MNGDNFIFNFESFQRAILQNIPSATTVAAAATPTTTSTRVAGTAASMHRHHHPHHHGDVGNHNADHHQHHHQQQQQQHDDVPNLFVETMHDISSGLSGAARTIQHALRSVEHKTKSNKMTTMTKNHHGGDGKIDHDDGSGGGGDDEFAKTVHETINMITPHFVKVQQFLHEHMAGGTTSTSNTTTTTSTSPRQTTQSSDHDPTRIGATTTTSAAAAATSPTSTSTAGAADAAENNNNSWAYKTNRQSIDGKPILTSTGSRTGNDLFDSWIETAINMANQANSTIAAHNNRRRRNENNDDHDHDRNDIDRYNDGHDDAHDYDKYHSDSEYDDDDDVDDDDSLLQDETSQIRRLGSWGTVGSAYTAGTFGTQMTYDTYTETNGDVTTTYLTSPTATTTSGGSGRGGVPIRGVLKKQPLDDEGRPINPILLKKTKDFIKRQHDANGGRPSSSSNNPIRRRRRRKVVQFEYPPIKSLRQYKRPDPEDLPKLFFTEGELDQIEEDRYNTMSTDDIEIVAVSSDPSHLQHHSAAAGRTIVDENDDDDLTTDNGAREDGDDEKEDEIDEVAEAREGCDVADDLDDANIEKKLVRAAAATTSAADAASETYEKGCRPVKGRSGTPFKRRSSAGIEETSPTIDVNDPKSKSKSTSSPAAVVSTVLSSKNKPVVGKSKSPSSNNHVTTKDSHSKPKPTTTNTRLVKGVQIFLRERSTGVAKG